MIFSFELYDTNYSGKQAPYPQSFLETVVVTEITDGVLSRFGLAVKGQ